ncbi:MAG: hypothetical protein HC836_38200 [Richelia sp. RM2_1_2]|nr:hypothetical protein [Richelia sp. RM1_1_1]NJO63812.1 hypothetical protein [Richelia sp. RM2_1_2]
MVATSNNSVSLLNLAQLAPSLDELYTQFIQELPESGEKHSLNDLIKMLKVCPINRVAIEIKALRAITALGNYHHPDKNPYSTGSGYKTVEEWVRGNFESMRGSLASAAGKLIRQAYALGFCCAEIVWEKKVDGIKPEWRLRDIVVLNPTRFTFAGKLGRVDRIIYKSSLEGEFAIPYSKLVHLYCPKIEEPSDPRGDAQASRAYPFYKARQVFFHQWTVAGQRQATGLLLIQAPSNDSVVILDSKGQPIKNPDGTVKTTNAVYAAVKAAKEVESGSIFGTDLKNKVTSIPGNAGENFFNVALQHYQKMIFYCYGVPSTIFDDTQSGIGNAGINAGHRLILDNQIEAMIDHLRDELLEKVVRPLLVANFGRKFEQNLGEFKSEKFIDPGMAAARVSNLTMALSTGTLDANDLEAVNRLREDLGLSPFTRQQFDTQQLAKLLAQQEYAEA